MLAIATCGLSLLVARWLPRLRLVGRYSPCKLHVATQVLTLQHEQYGYSRVRQLEVNAMVLRVFEHWHLRYVYHADTGQFVLSKYVEWW